MMNAPMGHEHVVKKSKFTKERMAFAVRQPELDARMQCGFRRVRAIQRQEGYRDRVKRVHRLSS